MEFKDQLDLFQKNSNLTDTPSRFDSKSFVKLRQFFIFAFNFFCFIFFLYRWFFLWRKRKCSVGFVFHKILINLIDIAFFLLLFCLSYVGNLSLLLIHSRLSLSLSHLVFKMNLFVYLMLLLLCKVTLFLLISLFVILTFHFNFIFSFLLDW